MATANSRVVLRCRQRNRDVAAGTVLKGAVDFFDACEYLSLVANSLYG
jgi:hypothetical protein